MTYYKAPTRTPEQVQNLQKFINMLWGVPAENFIMRDVKCGTACCIEGFRQEFLGIEAFKPGTSAGQMAERQFGIPASVWSDITLMASTYSMRGFDKLPAEERKLAMLEVLTDQLNTGRHDWTKTLVDVFSPEVAKELADAYKEDRIALSESQEVPALRPAVRSNPPQQAPVQRAMRDRAGQAEEAALLLEEVC